MNATTTTTAPINANDERPDDSEVVHSGFTLGQLQSAFNAVRNQENWKYPIFAEIDAADVLRHFVAIMWFVGAYPSVNPGSDPTRVMITSPGYYAICGA